MEQIEPAPGTLPLTSGTATAHTQSTPAPKQSAPARPEQNTSAPKQSAPAADKPSQVETPPPKPPTPAKASQGVDTPEKEKVSFSCTPSLKITSLRLDPAIHSSTPAAHKESLPETPSLKPSAPAPAPAASATQHLDTPEKEAAPLNCPPFLQTTGGTHVQHILMGPYPQLSVDCMTAWCPDGCFWRASAMILLLRNLPLAGTSLLRQQTDNPLGCRSELHLWASCAACFKVSMPPGNF